MKRLMLVVILSVIFCSGCFDRLATSVSVLNESVDDLQLITEELASENVIDAEKLDKINDNIDKVQKDAELVKEAIADAKDPIEAAEKGWDASKPFNPYYGYGAAIIAILKLFSAAKEKKEVEAKYSAAKNGMDKFRNDNPDKAKELYEDVGAARKTLKV